MRNRKRWLMLGLALLLAGCQQADPPNSEETQPATRSEMQLEQPRMAEAQQLVYSPSIAADPVPAAIENEAEPLSSDPYWDWFMSRVGKYDAYRQGESQ